MHEPCVIGHVYPLTKFAHGCRHLRRGFVSGPKTACPIRRQMHPTSCRAAPVISDNTVHCKEWKTKNDYLESAHIWAALQKLWELNKRDICDLSCSYSVAHAKASLFGEPCLIARLNPVTFVTCIYHQRVYAVIVFPHCCPVKSRTESIGCWDQVNLYRSRMREVPVKWAFSRIV